MTVESTIQAKFGRFKRSKGKHGVEFIVTCPFCKKRDKLYINPAHGTYYCFRCGEAGGTETLLGQKFNLEPETNTRPQPLPTNVVPPGELITLNELDDQHPARRYLARRKRDIAELTEVYGVRYCWSGKLFAQLYNTTNTLIFPIWFNGQIVGWQSRLLYDPDKLTDEECALQNLAKDEDGDWVKPPKYWTSPGLPKGRILYNYDWARQGNLVVLTEGVFDSIAIGRCAVASLGKDIADNQIELLRLYWDLVILMLDPDAADKMTSLLVSLRDVKTVMVTLQGYKDPGEAPRDQIWIQIGETAAKQGINIFDYRFTL
jgi:hypothetical protein